jgi:hypothetical protein
MELMGKARSAVIGKGKTGFQGLSRIGKPKET